MFQEINTDNPPRMDTVTLPDIGDNKRVFFCRRRVSVSPGTCRRHGEVEFERVEFERVDFGRQYF